MTGRGARPPAAGDYVVGYRRPPVDKQFKPGQSGNPHGRPKAAPSLAATLTKHLSRSITVQENGKARRMTTQEVMVTRLINDAIRGDPKAMKLLLSMIQRLQIGVRDPGSGSAAPISADDEAILAAYFSRQQITGSTATDAIPDRGVSDESET